MAGRNGEKSMFGKKVVTTVLAAVCSVCAFGQNFDTEGIEKFLKQGKNRNFNEVMDIDVARLAPHDQKGKNVVVIGIYIGASSVKGDIQEKYKPERFRVLDIKSDATGFSVYAPTKGKQELVKKIALLNEDDVVALFGKVREVKYKVPRGPRGRNVTERVFCFEVEDVVVIPPKIAFIASETDDEDEDDDTKTPRKRRKKVDDESADDEDTVKTDEKDSDDGDTEDETTDDKKDEDEPEDKPETEKAPAPAGAPAPAPENTESVTGEDDWA